MLNVIRVIKDTKELKPININKNLTLDLILIYQLLHLKDYIFLYLI